MSTLTVDIGDLRAVAASVDDEALTVRFADGRVVTAPLAWFPRLAAGSPEARNAIEISPLGLHWPVLDEDIGLAGLLAGRRAVAAE